MSLIPPAQWRPLFDAVYEMNSARDHSDFLSAAVAGVSRLIWADHFNVHLLGRPTGRLAFAMLPSILFNAAEIEYHKAHSQNHPVVADYSRTGDIHARRVSDILPTSAWRAHEFYRHTTARRGFAYQLSLPLELDETTLGAITLSRCHRNFTRRHCELLDAFAPHFRLAWSRHRDPWRRVEQSEPTARERFRAMGLSPRRPSKRWRFPRKRDLTLSGGNGAIGIGRSNQSPKQLKEKHVADLEAEKCGFEAKLPPLIEPSFNGARRFDLMCSSETRNRSSIMMPAKILEGLVGLFVANFPH